MNAPDDRLDVVDGTTLYTVEVPRNLQHASHLGSLFGRATLRKVFSARNDRIVLSFPISSSIPSMIDWCPDPISQAGELAHIITPSTQSRLNFEYIRPAKADNSVVLMISRSIRQHRSKSSMMKENKKKKLSVNSATPTIQRAPSPVSVLRPPRSWTTLSFTPWLD